MIYVRNSSEVTPIASGQLQYVGLKTKSFPVTKIKIVDYFTDGNQNSNVISYVTMDCTCPLFFEMTEIPVSYIFSYSISTNAYPARYSRTNIITTMESPNVIRIGLNEFYRNSDRWSIQITYMYKVRD